jgi:hypothetical protein
MNRDQHMDSVWNDKIRPLLLEASDIIEALKPGEKIPATELARIIAERHGMTGPQLYPVLVFLFRDYPGVEVKRGAHGGISRPLVPKV